MKIEEQLRTALREHAPTVDERAAWARTALEQAPSPSRRSYALVSFVAAAAIGLVAVLLPKGQPQKPEWMPHAVDNPPESPEVARERVKNHDVLELSRTDWKKKKGWFMAVVGGGNMHVGRDAKGVVEWADKTWPEARHRFVFRIDGSRPPYEMVADRGPVRAQIVGMFFLQDAGITLQGKPGDWKFTRGKTTVSVRERQPVLTLRVLDRWVKVVVVKDSLCSLMLPEGMRFALYEVPGNAIYEGLDRKWYSFRRYLVRVRHPGLGLDEWLDASGARRDGPIAPGNVFAVRLGSHVFQALKVTPKEAAALEKKPLAVLHLRDADTERLHRLLAKVEDGNFAQLYVPGRKRSILKVYDTQGRLIEELDLAEATVSQLRRLLR